MKLLSQKRHPNGLKILIAAKLCGHEVDVVEAKSGTVLEVQEGNTVYTLQANSAVLHLFWQANDPVIQNLASVDSEEWLQWEATDLQPVLVPYLASVAAGREDKTLRNTLSQVLGSLNSASFLNNKEVSAASVVVFSSLLPLVHEAVSQSLLKENNPALVTYLSSMQDQTLIKECIKQWCGQGSVLKTWVVNASIPLSPSHSTLALLRSQAAMPHGTVTSATEQVKPVKAAITTEQLAEAKSAWTNPSKLSCDEKVSRQGPVVPVDGEHNVLITSALPYVNNVPHLGNIIGCVLSADCFARFCRLRGDNVLYICGTDEYGTATETKALAEGLTPQQICDKYHAIHSKVYQWFGISFDYFGRTTTEHQTKICQDIFWSLEKNGKISKDSVDQLYCSKCDRFLADRFVEGVCPYPGCGYEDARGDQCDACGKLINAIELVKPRCKLCSTSPEVRSSNHLFLDLPKIEKSLSEWLSTSSKQWTNNAKVICDTWVRDGLKTRCITRDLKWGTPVPLDGFKDKVFYVWFDAPIGYVSITANYTNEWEKWWKNPSQVNYYEFMAKDNVPFHSVVFPSTQLGTGENWTMVNYLVATEYLNYEDGKFSKSRGVGVFGDQAIETGIPSDVWRFYLLYLRPEAQDTAFSWVDLQTKNNSELLNNFGNFIHRALSFVFKFFEAAIPEAKPDESDFMLMAAVNQELKHYTTALANNRQRDGLRAILSITKIGNQYIQEHEPYKLVKPNRTEKEKERGASVIAIAANLVCLVSIIADPYMPEIAKNIRGFLNLSSQQTRLPGHFCCLLPAGHKIQEPKPLIIQIDDETVNKFKEQFAGKAPSEKKAADPAEIAKLEAQIAEQSAKVRKLKESGTASKDEILAEVTILLSLKGQLAALQGVDPAAGGKEKKKKKGGGAGKEQAKVPPASSSVAPATIVNPAEVERLQGLVTEKGGKVRALKGSGTASKEEIATEVLGLLKLKEELALAQGIDPSTLNAKKKK
ncbi:methionine--tRNA ligase, cytoplasmic isoform X1 [Penaeus vannamei]|uniref:methionine--tRNA ligase, cytoplasmic isoform X1 n=1 Tax=Penaeus vannamei TaxID=6689 RepID=UPI00387F5D43